MMVVVEVGWIACRKVLFMTMETRELRYSSRCYNSRSEAFTGFSESTALPFVASSSFDLLDVQPRASSRSGRMGWE